ncbi:MAG: glutamate--tRNA ligase [Dehalococcoidia bacterium]|nr:glutamate--tRNA ligase [Dehalococcoidia bacterium]MDH4367580.1 glutamate--tRNA ligase [Dehalococcoidia bacterium]
MQSESQRSVRLRFAPSPTGYPHLGNIRTALFNWLFARRHDGIFILRIEDTDVARKVEGAVDIILDSLRWLGLDWDEGPYFQSQRLSIYRETAQRLIDEDHAYSCYCSPERLGAMRQEQMKRKQPPKYDRRCRDLTQQQGTELKAAGVTPVIRFKTPLEGETTFHDLIYGRVTFRHDTLDDFVLLKSDGYPTYHLANIVDDHFMDISHVLRAEEWLSSTPRHVLLYQALDWQAPQFAHLPMILGPDRAKLSKRHGATNINEYQKEGYLPDAMVNFLALLGWSLDDRTELLSREELIKHFSLERVGKTAAIFNKEKLEWMNGVYLRRLGLTEFVHRAMPFLDKSLPESVRRPLDEGYVSQVLSLIQERAKTLAEVPQLADFFFLDELLYDARLLSKGKLDAKSGIKAIMAASQKLEQAATWDAITLEGILRALATELKLPAGELFGVLRVAITGRTAAPPLFQTMAVLGKEKCLKRLEMALQLLEADLN